MVEAHEGVRKLAGSDAFPGRGHPTGQTSNAGLECSEARVQRTSWSRPVRWVCTVVDVKDERCDWGGQREHLAIKRNKNCLGNYSYWIVV